MISSDISIDNPTGASPDQLLRQATPPARVILAALVAAQARRELFIAGQPVIVAVSGGADSLCLLHALHQLAPCWRVSLHVAHLDHALRPESAADAAFVADVAQKLALPFYTTRLTPGILDDDPQGLEAAARSARYAFLRQVADQMGAPVTLATAHHQDDQAETLLLHLVQGSGLPGLAGMAWVGQLPDAAQPPIRLVRPLLATRRAAIHEYLRSEGLAWREDHTNQDPAHLRNRLRHEVLPTLEAINPNIHATLARTAHLLATEADHAASRDRATLDAVTVTYTPSTRLILDLFHLAEYDEATRRGTLRQAFMALGIDLRAVGLDGIDRLLNQADPFSPTFAPGGPHPLLAEWQWTILGSGAAARLALHRAGVLPQPVDHPHVGAPLATPLPLPPTGALSHTGWQLQSTLLAPGDLPADWRSRSQPWRLLCDAEQSGELYLTTPQAGMKIAPLGMGGRHRAVGDIFTDHKIAPYLRPGWPVVVAGDGTVIWLCGLTMADTVRIHSSTRQVGQLIWQRNLDTQVVP
ncbi:MAG: tRNA lysidine(34) synthetase TilS [Caldilineaceae bacterium]|nr:tRNA lysidine(34) synthetase TilS [Caldilineaceae bacterium]